MRQTLTAKIIRGLRSEPGRDVFVFDMELPGFGVRVHPSGNKSYFWKSRQGRLSLGDVRNQRLEQARDIAREYKALARKGINVKRYLEAEREANQRQERQSSFTMEIAFREYAALRQTGGAGTKQWSRSSARAYASAWRWIADDFEGRHPADISAPEWVAMLAEHRQDHPGMAKTMLAVVKGLYVWLTTASVHAVDVTNNPVRDIKISALPARSNYFSPADLRRLYDAVDGFDIYEATALRLLILTARRRSEIERLSWGEIDFADGVITIPESRTKTSRDDQFPITPRIAALLDGLPRQNGPYIFSRDGGHSAISLSLTKARSALGAVPSHTGVDWRFHDFRRSLGTAIDNADGDHNEKEIVLSHSLGALDKTYSRSQRLSLKRRWLEWWDSQIF